MIQNKEIIEWFNNYYDNCYDVIHEDFPESIFMFYDINYVRQLKLAKLEGKKYVEKTDITGVCLFEQDWKYKLFRCDYNLIWCYFKNNYSFNFTDFQSFITDRLDERSKMNVLTPPTNPKHLQYELDERSKMNVLTPTENNLRNRCLLDERSKMNVLTPNTLKLTQFMKLDERSKMNVLTPSNIAFHSRKLLDERSKMNVLTPSPPI